MMARANKELMAIYQLPKEKMKHSMAKRPATELQPPLLITMDNVPHTVSTHHKYEIVRKFILSQNTTTTTTKTSIRRKCMTENDQFAC